jgi:predicted MPP superfamily phosphohydrolase
VFLAIASIAPLARYWHSGPSYIRESLSMISGYLVPFILYLFLAVLVFDLFLLINLAVRILPASTRKGFRFRLYTFVRMILLSTVVVVGGAINLNTVRISQYQIEIPKKNSKLSHLRIAFVADLHIDQNLKLSFVKQYVRKVNALNPDIVLYGGDIVEGRWDENVSAEIIKTMKTVESKYGEYGILGNHEYYGSEKPGQLYQRVDISLLHEKVIKIGQSFYLAGRDDDHADSRKSLEELLQHTPDDLPVIVIDHRPTELQEASRTKADIQFSGHTHNGQMFPINLFLKRMYELSWGYKKIRDTHFFVTSGLRLWGPPVKTAGKSEIMVVDVVLK